MDDNPSMDKKLWMASIAVSAALLLELVLLLELYELVDLRWSHFKTIATFLKFFVLIGFCRFYSVPHIIKPVCILLVAIIGNAVLPGYAVPIARFVMGESLVPIYLWVSLVGIVAIVTKGVVALAWIVVGSHLLLSKQQDKFNGYAPVLGTAAIIVGVFEVLVLFKVPILLGHLCFSFAFLGLLLSLYAPRFVLSYRRQAIFYTVTLGIPGILYVAPMAFGVGGFVLRVFGDEEFWHSTSARVAPIDTVVEWKDLLDESLTNYNTLYTLPLFNDYWLFADNRQMAVNNTGVYERATAEGEWQLVFSPDEVWRIEYIHFDNAGVKGVIGLGEGAFAYSEDGGTTWTQPDLFEVFKDLSGREYGDSYLDDHSRVFIDPETGRGSFVMGCGFFTSDNYTRSWTMRTITDRDGKTRCLGDYPFALDEKHGLALASSSSEYYIMARVDDQGEAYWEPYCALDAETGITIELPVCEKDGVLSESLQQFLDKLDNQSLFQQIDMDEEVLDQIIEGEPIASDTYQHALRDNGNVQWLSGRGYLLIRESGGAFRVDYRVPDIDWVYPVDDSRAVGFGEWNEHIYQTADQGRTWQRIKRDPGNIEIHTHADEEGAVYYAEYYNFIRLKDSKLEILHTTSGEEEIQRIIISRNGKKLLLVMNNGFGYWYSADSGVSWSNYELPSPPAVSGEYKNDRKFEYEEEPEIASLDCILEGSVDECIAVYDDGRVLTWNPEDSSNSNVLPDVILNEDGWAGGEIALLGNAPARMYFPADDMSELQLLQDDQWESVPLPMRIYNVYNRDYTPDRSKILFETEDEEILIIGPTGKHALFRHEEFWGEQRQCFDASGEQMIMIDYHHEHIVFSNDHGTKWLTNRESLGYGIACGIRKQWLWLIGDSLTVHSRKP